MAIQFSTSINGLKKNSLIDWLCNPRPTEPVAEAQAEIGHFWFDTSSTAGGGRGVLMIRGGVGGVQAGGKWWPVPFGAVGTITTPPVDANRAVTTYDGLVPIRASNNRINARADWALQLDTARFFSLTGKATGTATSFDGSANCAIPVTALNVDPGDINLGLDTPKPPGDGFGKLIRGTAGGKGEAVAMKSLLLNQWGLPDGNVDLNAKRIVNMANPIDPQDAVTLGYLQANSAGLQPQKAVGYATEIGKRLPDYNVISAGVLEAKAVGSLTIDGHTVTASDVSSGTRFLVKDEPINYYYGADAIHNGIYVCTVLGDVGTKWRLQRADDANTTPELQPGFYYFVTGGLTMANTGWVMSSPKPFVLDVDDCLWNQFSGGTTLVEGRGIKIEPGNKINFAQLSDYSPLRTIPYTASATGISFTNQGVNGHPLVQGGSGPSIGPLDLNGAYTWPTPVPTDPLPVRGKLKVQFGGTGIDTISKGGVLIGKGNQTASDPSPGKPWDNMEIADPGPEGYMLISNGDTSVPGVRNAPTFQPLNLSRTPSGTHNSVTGVLPVANGGTGGSTWTAGGMLYGNLTSQLGITAALADNRMIIGVGGVPTVLPTDSTSDVIPTFQPNPNPTAIFFTIKPGSVTLGKFQQFKKWSVLGNPTAGVATPIEIEAVTDLSVLQLRDGVLKFATISAGSLESVGMMKVLVFVIPVGTTTSTLLTHGLNNTDFDITVYRTLTSGDRDTVYCDTYRTPTQFRLVFNPDTTEQYTAVIMGKQS